MARKAVTTFVCVSDISGEEFAEGQGASVTIAFDGGKTYAFDATQEEAHAILAGVKSPREAGGRRASAGSTSGGSGVKAASGGAKEPFGRAWTPTRWVNEFKRGASDAEAFFAKWTPEQIQASIAKYGDEHKQAWDAFVAGRK